MADFNLNKVIVSYEGEKNAVAVFHKALKAREDETVENTLAWLEDNGYKIDLKKHRFINDELGDLDIPNDLEDLIHEFPAITFIIDLIYTGTAAGCSGSGRYFCVFENGKKVYDANCWLEQLAFLNVWADNLRIKSGNFYRMDREKAKQVIARGRLAEKGKKPDKITQKDIDNYLDKNDFEYDYSVWDGDTFLIDGHDFDYWSQNLCDEGYSFDGGYGLDHYRELKEEGELPSLNAKSRWRDLLEIKDRKEKPPKSVQALIKIIQNTKNIDLKILPKGQWWNDKDQCLKLYAKKFGENSDLIREYIGYCFPKELWLDPVYFAKAAKITGKVFVAEEYTSDTDFMRKLKKVIENYKKSVG